jgi:hypothetical protein
MAFLPDRYRAPHDRYPARYDAPARGPSVMFLLICAGCVALGAWLGAGRPIIQPQQHVVVVQPRSDERMSPPDARRSPPAAASQQSSFWNWLNGNRCADADGHVRSLDSPNYAGITPVDYFHFLPPCQGGRR